MLVDTIDNISDGLETDRLISEAVQNLNHKNAEQAKSLFELIITKVPGEQIGYVGKSVSLALSTHSTIGDVLSPIREALNKECDEKHKRTIKELINTCFEANTTLLMHACYAKWSDVVEYLVSMGADVNAKSIYDVTALWYIAHEKLSQETELEGRKIAHILIENGALVDITSKSGISLYNLHTDHEIKKMIKAKDQTLKAGKIVSRKELDEIKIKPNIFFCKIAYLACFLISIVILFSGAPLLKISNTKSLAATGSFTDRYTSESSTTFNIYEDTFLLITGICYIVLMGIAVAYTLINICGSSYRTIFTELTQIFGICYIIIQVIYYFASSNNDGVHHGGISYTEHISYGPSWGMVVIMLLIIAQIITNKYLWKKHIGSNS